MRYYSINYPVPNSELKTITRFFRTLEDVQEVVEEVLTRDQELSIILATYIVSPKEYEDFWTVRLLDGPID